MPDYKRTGIGTRVNKSSADENRTRSALAPMSYYKRSVGSTSEKPEDCRKIHRIAKTK